MECQIIAWFYGHRSGVFGLLLTVPSFKPTLELHVLKYSQVLISTFEQTMWSLYSPSFHSWDTWKPLIPSHTQFILCMDLKDSNTSMIPNRGHADSQIKQKIATLFEACWMKVAFSNESWNCILENWYPPT
jgi:hypothetical protein